MRAQARTSGARSNAREPSAFERDVLPYLDDAYAVARYVLRDDLDAQDAVQDAVLRGLRYYRPEAVQNPRAWLLTIVRRCSHARIAQRSRTGRDVPETELLSIPDPAPGPDAAASAWSLHRAVETALDSLPRDQREILVLREVQQLSYREISQVVGLPMGTVMSRLSRARKRLQKELAGVLAGPAGSRL